MNSVEQYELECMFEDAANRVAELLAMGTEIYDLIHYYERILESPDLTVLERAIHQYMIDLLDARLVK